MDLSKLSIKIDSDGIIMIDLIESDLFPEKKYLLNLLKGFEQGNGNYYLSDECDYWWDELEKMIALHLKVESVSKIYLVISPDMASCPSVALSEYDDPSVRSRLLRWVVFKFFSYLGVGESILLEDVPFIREFLNTPPGKEKEACEKWEAYWDKVDFDERRKYAPM